LKLRDEYLQAVQKIKADIIDTARDDPDACLGNQPAIHEISSVLSLQHRIPKLHDTMFV